MAWTETYCLFALLNLPRDRNQNSDVLRRFCEMWKHLRAGALFFLRYDDGQHTDAHIAEAHEHLKAYAVLAEQVRTHRARDLAECWPASVLMVAAPRLAPSRHKLHSCCV